MSNVINLRLINRSNDVNNTSYVIFQKNVSTTFEELAVAWRVIQNLDVGEYHPFTYSDNLQVAASDSWGNYTFPIDAKYGLMYQMLRNPSGDQLAQKGEAAGPREIDVKNSLPEGSMNALCYRDDKVLAMKTSIAPEQKATFEFKPTIFIGAVSQVEEGEIMNSAILSNINTEISLLGIQSADIIITGGGSGPSSTEFQFTLENVKFA